MKENMDEHSVQGATGTVQKLMGDIINGMLGGRIERASWLRQI